MKNYELTYLMSSELSEEEVKSFQERITSLVKEEGGVLGEENTFLRRKLAYPIKGQTQAYLAVSDFHLNPGSLVNLEKKLKENSQILRYLILIKPKVKEMKFARRKIVPEKIHVTPREEKVELKEIEKKLEEILKE